MPSTAFLRVLPFVDRAAYYPDMEIALRIKGEVVERQELLNGTQILTLEGDGAGEGGLWTATGLLSWNRGLKDTIEGDITLSRADGAELFATLVGGSVAEAGDDGAGGSEFKLRYEIDGGGGAFDSASGTIRAEGLVAESGFEGIWTIDVSHP